jgi:hypothetical protein
MKENLFRYLPRICFYLMVAGSEIENGRDHTIFYEILPLYKKFTGLITGKVKKCFFGGFLYGITSYTLLTTREQ